MDTALRTQIERSLAQHRVMTLATVRPDGWPQATTVGFAHEASLCTSCAARTVRRRRTWRATAGCL